MTRLVVRTDGTVRCLYGEEIDLAALGEMDIARASYVEPDAGGQWWAHVRWRSDAGGIAGADLGPFGCRSEAVAAETRHIEDQL